MKADVKANLSLPDKNEQVIKLKNPETTQMFMHCDALHLQRAWLMCVKWICIDGFVR